MKRRNLLKSIALGATAIPLVPVFASTTKKKEATIQFSLNTSTLRGQKLDLPQIIEIAAKAGYDGIELWISELDAYLKTGKSLASLKKLFVDAKIIPVNAIGFAPWMAQEVEKSKAGFEQMEKEMAMLAAIGCKRIAAPAIGATAPIDLLAAGEQYASLLDLGRKTGVMPQLEFWGAYDPFHQLGQALATAAAANDPDARILPDVYHLFRGGSGFEGLKLVNGNAIEVFHMNDFTSKPRLEQKDSDRVYPGDGIGPMKEIAATLKAMGGNKILSLEVFNETYWAQDAQLVANTGLKKMKQFF
ncbi:sugar phosphate isomerase/epimerase [Algoriphagus ratkowskyi]|uniref:Sugar phosphate isomerase/epimerase n=1 Tax=Algoriphagus ratkowskyi TaxID=57028 RepID=A0A2W7R8Z4_9BACT|nr:sugar phosphate isomerase/epimerase [Algoriphagus ratkowskyi]PZX50689.1 sugar phosphate isomerase/epimerase [Algoriphagus ratkowskyi]TXD75819.1 sugar phosphate isomerase/epimerase [Algoriphagus ratkowskyi]